MSRPLQRMFTEVPPRYDLINSVVTWGLDRRWRRKAAQECLKSKPEKVLDLCCGTGDLAITVCRLGKNEVCVVGIDYSPPMLEIARKKAAPLDGDKHISFINGDAASLPFPDASFDSVGISFAFRNLTYKNPLARQHLAEVRRVLTAGGRYVIVETGQPTARLIRGIFHRYLRWTVRSVGGWLSGNRGAYSYLAESAASFYTAEEVKGMLLESGFRQVLYQPFLFGAAGIHIAVK
jgi:demethylmenaquinone methyltransferase/2-methoxy-6-polyprenyl-1,4-benzoquinol methylase